MYYEEEPEMTDEQWKELVEDDAYYEALARGD